MIDRHLLRYLRQNAGLTTTEMAQRLGYNQSYISLVELGQRAISGEYLKRFLSHFDFTISDFDE